MRLLTAVWMQDSSTTSLPSPTTSCALSGNNVDGSAASVSVSSSFIPLPGIAGSVRRGRQASINSPRPIVTSNVRHLARKKQRKSGRWYPQWHRQKGKFHTSLSAFFRDDDDHGGDDGTVAVGTLAGGGLRPPPLSLGPSAHSVAAVSTTKIPTAVDPLHHLKDWYFELMRSRRARWTERYIAEELSREIKQHRREQARRRWQRRWGVQAKRPRPSSPPLLCEAEEASVEGCTDPLTQTLLGGGGSDSANDPSRRPQSSSRRHRPSPGEVVKIAVMMLSVIVGCGMQVIFLNFWLRQYPADGAPGNYTTLAVSSVMFSLFFTTTLALHLFIERPSLRFAWNWDGLRCLMYVGIGDTLCSAMTIYAASHTSEVLQALFTSLVPVYTAIFQKRILHDARNYRNPWVISSFAFIISGVIMAVSYTFLHPYAAPDGDEGGGGGKYISHASRIAWSVVFACSVLPSVVQNVYQTSYMIRFTRDPLFERWVLDKAIRNGDIEEQSLGIVDEKKDWMDGEARMPFVGDEQKRKQLEQWQRQLACDADGEEGADGVGGDRSWSPPLPIGVGRMSSGFSGEDSDVGLLSLYGTFSQDGSYPTEEEASTTLPPVVVEDEPGGGDGDRNSSNGVASCLYSLRNESTHIQVQYTVPQGDDLTVKLFLLAADTTIQALLSLLLLPADALPWWGGSSSVSGAWQNLRSGVRCLIYCKGNLMFCCLYCLGFVFTYVGSAYLDQYNVTLCSMVSQLSAPITALLLIAFPLLNLSGDTTPWQYSVCAVVMLACGALLYTAWDQRTYEERIENENSLKEAYVQPNVVVVHE